MLIQRHDSSSTSRRWTHKLLGRLQGEKKSQYPSRSQGKHYFGCCRKGKCQALVSGIHRERRRTSGSAEGWDPFFLALLHHILGLSPCLLFSASLSSYSIAEGKSHTTRLGAQNFGYKGKEVEANEDLNPSSFLSPCKSAPVCPGCAPSWGFHWDLSLPWVKELSWMSYLGTHRWNQPHADESHLALVHLNAS